MDAENAPARAGDAGGAQCSDVGELDGCTLTPLSDDPQAFDLRPYQAEAVGRLSAATGRPLLVAPTGSGKTVIAAAVIRRAVDRGRRVLFLAHRRELIRQAQGKLWSYGVDAGLILAGETMRLHEPVQIASVQTLWARAMRTRRIELPPADIVVIDEAHHVRARTYKKIIGAYPDATAIGLTATPCRGDGRGLGNVFDELVECPPVQELIDHGYLVRTKVFAPSTPDLTGVRVERGDYAPGQLAERMDQAKLIGDIVEHWHRLAEGRPTVVFATGVNHSAHLRDEFLRSGVLAEHIDGKTPIEDRDRILDRLARGEVEVVCNAMVLTEGWDCPSVSAIVLARPTRHIGLYRQMVGRVLRPAEGKIDALVLDHAGATFRHGFVEDPVAWTLATDARAENAVHAARGDGDGWGLRTCPECSAVRLAGQPCSACGWRPKPKPRPVEVADGELAQVERDGRRPETWTASERSAFHAELLWIARDRGYAPGWAAHQFRKRFGAWPDAPKWAPPAAKPPSDATRAWVRSRQIAYAKAMQKART